jgi:hypothetical protein
VRRAFWKLVAGLVLALAGLGSFNLALWVSDRDPPIRYSGVRALAPTVEQGGTIGVEFDVFRERICPVTVRRWLYDSASTRHSIPSFTTGLELLAGREVYQRLITVPPGAATGHAQYQVVLDYACNPVHRLLNWPIIVHAPPVRFRIVEGAAPAPEGDEGDG